MSLYSTHLRRAESEDIGRPAHGKANVFLVTAEWKSQVGPCHIEDGGGANGKAYAGHSRKVARIAAQPIFTGDVRCEEFW